MRMSAVIKENCELIALLCNAIRDATWQTPMILMIHPKEISCWAGSIGDILGKLRRKAGPSWHFFHETLYFQPHVTVSKNPSPTSPSAITLMRPKHSVDISGMLLCMWNFNHHSR